MSREAAHRRQLVRRSNATTPHKDRHAERKKGQVKGTRSQNARRDIRERKNS